MSCLPISPQQDTLLHPLLTFDKMELLVYPCLLFLSTGAIFSYGKHNTHSPVHFYLYPFSSHPEHQEELYPTTKSLNSSSFKKDAKTVVIIHGFWPNSSYFTPLQIKNAFLQSYQHAKLNCIYLDWSHLATPTNIHLGLLKYPQIVHQHAPLVALKLAQLINFLLKHNFTSLEQVHLVGYSLGAHVAGLTGQVVSITNQGKKLARITGLDPPLPVLAFSKWRLSKNDADFVDIYHTSMAMWGFLRRDGHVDFYPNGGRSPQPGCLFSPDGLLPLVCSHLFAIKLFMDSMHHNFLACKCEPLLDLWVGVMCFGGCRTFTFAGAACPINTRGQFFFKTSALMP